MDRCPASQFIHFFDSRTHSLACRFVNSHIGWSIRAEQVNCPACREILRRGVAPAPDPEMVAPRDSGRTPGGLERMPAVIDAIPPTRTRPTCSV